MTKKLRYFCTLLLMMVAGVAWADDTWVETAATDLKTGDIVVIVDKTTAKAMSNNNGTSAPSATSVALSTDKTQITSTVASTIQWTVTVGDDGFQFSTGTNYLYCTDTNNGVKVGTDKNTVFTFSEGYLLHSGTSRYVGCYNKQDWRCYSSINNNIQNTVTTFYKKSSLSSTAVAPTFSPSGGKYTEAQTVTITSETQGASIYYTLDGSTPTTSSTLYTEPITISETATLKAIATKSDMNNSAVSTAEYTIITSTDGKITDVMTAGDLTATSTSYKDFTGVTLISDAVYAGNSAKNNGNIQLRSSNSNSGIVTTTSGGTILTVKINVANGNNTIDVYGSNTAYESAADLYNASKQGTKLGSVSTTETISVSGDYKYVGVRANNGVVYLSSIEFTWNTSTAPTAAAPTFSPAGGTYTEAQSVTISSATEGAAIYYTLDGSTPTTSSTLYTAPITISETATIKAIATKSGMNNSAVNSADYTILNVADAMTVAEGITYTQGVGTAGSTEPIMVKGVISQIEGLVGGTSITYWISDDGTTTNQMEVYKGKGLNGADFSAVTDLTVGDKVVVYGKVKMFSTTAEFDAGSILLSREENTDPYISAPDVVNLAYDATEGEIEVSIENAAIAILGGSIEEGCDWITDLNTSISPVTFKTTVNESNEPREATITFTGGGASKVVTITQAGAPVVYTTIPDIFAAAKEIGTTATDVLVKFGGWVVTGVSTNGKNVFVSDGTNGFIIFDSNGNLGFEVGNTLTSAKPISCKLQLFNGSAEITALTASAEGLTVGTGGSVDVAEITMANLTGVNTGALVSYKELTCSVQVNNEKTFYYLSDGTTTLQVYNTLYAFNALEAGKKYNITGVYQQFNTTKEILPRSAADIEIVSGISTGINNVEKIAEGAAIYNLNGVRVNKVQKGVYVVNGKKVVIK